MADIGKCSIDGLKLSSKGKNAVKEIHDIMYSGKVFSTVMAASPIIQIFASPSVTGTAAETAISIREYDWDTYSQAMSGIPNMVKNQVRNVAEPLTWYTSGKEGEFWRCVVDATI